MNAFEKYLGSKIARAGNKLYRGREREEERAVRGDSGSWIVKLRLRGLKGWEVMCSI